MSLRFIGEDEVHSRLRMPELIEAMERALVEFSSGRVLQPVRTVLEFGEERSIFGLMPSYVPSLPALGAKLLTVCAGNAARGIGTHQAVDRDAGSGDRAAGGDRRRPVHH